MWNCVGKERIPCPRGPGKTYGCAINSHTIPFFQEWNSQSCAGARYSFTQLVIWISLSVKLCGNSEMIDLYSPKTFPVWPTSAHKTVHIFFLVAALLLNIQVNLNQETNFLTGRGINPRSPPPPTSTYFWHKYYNSRAILELHPQKVTPLVRVTGLMLRLQGNPHRILPSSLKDHICHCGVGMANIPGKVTFPFS